jgi:hypothetical protein
VSPPAHGFVSRSASFLFPLTLHARRGGWGNRAEVDRPSDAAISEMRSRTKARAHARSLLLAYAKVSSNHEGAAERSFRLRAWTVLTRTPAHRSTQSRSGLAPMR